MLELPSGGQTGVLQRRTGVYRRHTWAAPTALVSFNWNVATLLLLAVAGTLNPHEAHMEPQQTPRDSALVGTPHQCLCSHDRDAGEHTMMRLGQLGLIPERIGTGDHKYRNNRTPSYNCSQLMGGHAHDVKCCSRCQLSHRGQSWQQETCTPAVRSCGTSTPHKRPARNEMPKNCTTVINKIILPSLTSILTEQWQLTYWQTLVVHAPFARAPLKNTRLWTSNYTWHAKAQIVAVKRWYHDNDLSTHMLTLQQALPSPHASGDAASTAGRPRWLMGIYQSNLHSAESCSLPNWQQLPPDSLSAMALAATTWHAAASTVHKSMPLDNHSDTIQMLHTRTRKGAHETLECINTSDKDAHRYKGTHAWHGEATQLHETGDSGERRVDSQMELIQVLRCIASGSCCRVFSATQLASAALEVLLALTITLISVSARLKATGCRGRAVKYMLPARRALGVLTKQADLCPSMLRYQKRLRHVRHRALRWFTHARAPCRRCKRSAVREQRYMERQLNRRHVKVMRYEQRTLVALALPMPSNLIYLRNVALRSKKDLLPDA